MMRGRSLGDVLAVIFLLALTTVFYHRTAFSDAILTGLDTFTYFYPNESYLVEALSQGRLPLWNPYLFTGVPFLANIQTAVFYPPNVLFLFFPVPRAYALSAIFHVFLAGSFMYLLCRRRLGLATTAALTGAVTFAFSGFFNSLVGHINQLHAATWIPLLFLLCDGAIVGRNVRVAALTGVVLAVQFTAGHSQESYLTIVGLALLVIYRLIAGRESGPHPHPLPGLARTGRSLIVVGGLFALIIGLAVGLASVQLLPSYELSTLSIRAAGLTYREAASFSLPPPLALKALLPLFGDAQLFSEWLGYVGVFGVFLAILGLVTAPRRSFVWLAIALAAVGLFFAVGQFNPLYPVAYSLVPGLKMFRVPARWLYLYTFGVSILAAYGVDNLGGRAAKAVLKRFLGTVAALAMVILATYLAIRNTTPMELPSSETRLIWLALALLAIAFVSVSVVRAKNLREVVFGLLALELFVASQGMPLNQITLPEAYSALRPAVAHFLIDGETYRILPISENSFDPGDIAELKEMLRGILTEKEVYDYLVAVKWKETMFPNLPLRYGIASIDGYDGGLLPLQSYVGLKQAFPLREKQAADGRLREELETVPDAKLLSMFNVKYVLMDRIRDAWVDGAFYDLAFSQELEPGGNLVSLEVVKPFETTSLGVVSHLSGATDLPTGEVAAWVKVTDSNGATYSFPLRAGLETAEGRFLEASRKGQIAHTEARRAKAWKGNPDAWDYIGKITFPSPIHPRSIEVRHAAGAGTLTLRGISLLDERTNADMPVVLSGSLRLDFLGDVKIYHNKDVWPRAFVVRPTETPPKEDARLRNSISQVMQIESAGTDQIGTVFAEKSDDVSKIVSYEPEQVDVEVNLTDYGFLVLTDSFYPGWHVHVDGSEKPMLRANGVFRAVELTPGKHLVRFVYDPFSLRGGAFVSLVSALLVVGLLVFARR